MSYHAIVRVDGKPFAVCLARGNGLGGHPGTDVGITPAVFETVELAEAAARACVPNLEAPEQALVIGALRIPPPKRPPAELGLERKH